MANLIKYKGRVYKAVDSSEITPAQYASNLGNYANDFSKISKQCYEDYKKCNKIHDILIEARNAAAAGNMDKARTIASKAKALNNDHRNFAFMILHV